MEELLEVYGRVDNKLGLVTALSGFSVIDWEIPHFVRNDRIIMGQDGRSGDSQLEIWIPDFWRIAASSYGNIKGIVIPNEVRNLLIP